jgi:multidrug transporter EmrE-like cation transporter
MNYLYIAGTILFMVYGQLILKWRLDQLAIQLPDDASSKILGLIRLIADPFILSGFIAAFLASLCWMAALTKFQISYAYPFIGLTFVLVFMLGAWLFAEPVTVYRVVGLTLVVAGLVVSSQG